MGALVSQVAAVYYGGSACAAGPLACGLCLWPHLPLSCLLLHLLTEEQDTTVAAAAAVPDCGTCPLISPFRWSQLTVQL